MDLLTTALVELDFFTWLAAHPSTIDVLRGLPRASHRATLVAERGYAHRVGVAPPAS